MCAYLSSERGCSPMYQGPTHPAESLYSELWQLRRAAGESTISESSTPNSALKSFLQHCQGIDLCVIKACKIAGWLESQKNYSQLKSKGFYRNKYITVEQYCSGSAGLTATLLRMCQGLLRDVSLWCVDLCSSQNVTFPHLEGPLLHDQVKDQLG